MKAAGEVLGRAFAAEGFMRYLVPDDARRARVLPKFLGSLVRYGLLAGEVYGAGDPLLGVAVWMPPGRRRLATPTLVRSGLFLSPLRLGLAGFRRLGEADAVAHRTRERVAPASHWYLWALGVDPAAQGRGVGGALLRPVLDRADRDGLPCYLETMDAVNVGFYARHGFEVRAEETLPGDGPRVWFMVRRAATEDERTTSSV